MGGLLGDSVKVVVRPRGITMPTIFRNEVEALLASVQEKCSAINERCLKTRLCVRQDLVQQRLAREIKVLLLRLKFIDPTNRATYDQNLAMVGTDLACEKSHLELVA